MILRILKWIGLIVGVGLIVVTAISMGRDMARTRAHQPVEAAIVRDVGFDYGTPYRDDVEVLMVRSVEPKKPAAQAGLQRGDVIIGYHDTRDMIDDFERARGRTITLAIDREGKDLRVHILVPKHE